MIKLEKIKRKNNIVECILTPEDSKDSSKFTYDLLSKEIDCIFPTGYEYCKKHVVKVIYWIEKNIDKLPEETLIMWY